MKKLFLISMGILLILSAWMSLALAEPFLVSDPAPVADAVTHTQVTINGTVGTWIPYQTQTIGGVLVCVFQDLAPLTTGTYTVTAKFKNVWGESVASSPFAFTKALPKAPTGVLIK